MEGRSQKYRGMRGAAREDGEAGGKKGRGMGEVGRMTSAASASVQALTLAWGMPCAACREPWR